MYLAKVILCSVLCVISEQTTFDKVNQGVTNITLHTIPGGTTIVWFGQNSITYIQGNYFKNLLNLREIWLPLNAITDISDSAFAQVPTVTEICLHYNELTVVREMMFSGLPNLAKLRLDYNQIHTVEALSFKDNTALTYLNLEWNSLQSVPRSVFDPTNYPTNLNDFRMRSNPLQCNSSLCWLKQLDTTWITVTYPYSTECTGPTALAGCKWDSLMEQDLCDTSG